VIRTICAASLIAVAAPALGQVTIQQVAPENSVLVIGVDNVGTARRKLEGHPLARWLSSAEGARALREALAGLPRDIRNVFQNGESMVLPTGALGGALFAAMDEERGVPEPALLLLADFGPQAEGLEGALTQAVSKASEQGGIQSAQRVIGGHTVHSVVLPAPQKAVRDPFADDGFEDDFGGLPQPEDFMDSFGTLHFARSESTLLVSSNLMALADALAVGDGQARRVLGGARAFQGLSGQLGGGDAFAVLLTRDLMQLITPLDPLGMSQLYAPMLRQLVGEVQGIGYAVHLGGPTGVERQVSAVFMPAGKSGVTALIDVAVPRHDPPAFVPADALSYTVMGMDFQGVVPFIDRFIASNPMVQMQLAGTWAEQRPNVLAAAGVMGSRLHLVHMLSNGVAGDLPVPEVVVAIDCAKPQEAKAMLAGLAQGFGMIEEGVAGHTMFAPQAVAGFGEMQGVPVIGLNGTHVIVGPRNMVKAVLGGLTGPVLARDPGFRQAMASLPSEPVVAWGYSNMGRMGDLANALTARLGQQLPPGMDQLQKTLSAPGVWFMQSTNEGFVSTMRATAPAEAAAQAGE
jgi:hypothetical protein